MLNIGDICLLFGVPRISFCSHPQAGNEPVQEDVAARNELPRLWLQTPGAQTQRHQVFFNLRQLRQPWENCSPLDQPKNIMDSLLGTKSAKNLKHRKHKKIIDILYGSYGNPIFRQCATFLGTKVCGLDLCPGKILLSQSTEDRWLSHIGHFLETKQQRLGTRFEYYIYTHIYIYINNPNPYLLLIKSQCLYIQHGSTPQKGTKKWHMGLSENYVSQNWTVTLH